MKKIKEIFTGLIIGLFFTGLFEFIVYFNFKNVWDNPQTYFGYHIHHSVVGLISIIIGLFFINRLRVAYFLVGLGLGIIILHTITDGRLVFIE